MAKIARKMSSYRLRAEVSEAVRLMADAGQVSQQEIVEEAVRLLAAKKKMPPDTFMPAAWLIQATKETRP